MGGRFLRGAVLASAAPALLALFAGLTAALAHAHYDHSTPAIGQVMGAAPTRVDIYTDTAMAPSPDKNTISVVNGAGQDVQTGNTVLDDADRRHLSVGLQPNLASGRYVVSFTTLSAADGDSDAGRFSFYIGRGPTAADKKLDAALTGAAPSASARSSGGHSTAVVGGIAVLLAIIAVGGALLWLRGRQRATI
jgi:methionine-rich copper-binding protein CopC